MFDSPTHAALKKKQREIRDDFPQTVSLRVHRSISWIGRAEQCGDDSDARFIFLWIAFNAAYADERQFHPVAPTERSAKERSAGERRYFDLYFKRLVALDGKRHIHTALWEQFSGPIRVLMQNRYVFNPFWKYHNGIAGYENWEKSFQAAERAFNRHFQNSNTVLVLKFVFDRLYVLRNQLVHGGSTWNSNVNRNQVRDGTAILGFLMPVFIDIMMDNPSKDWGEPFYPVIE